MSILQQNNVYGKYGVRIPKAKVKVTRKLSAGEYLTMYTNLSIASILLSKAALSFRHFKRLVDQDKSDDLSEVVAYYESFMKQADANGLGMENALKDSSISADCFYQVDKLLSPFLKKALNVMNFSNVNVDKPQPEVKQEGHYRAESNDKTATGEPNTILDLVVIKQGKGFRCINTDGSFKSYSYSDLKDEFQFFKTNS